MAAATSAGRSPRAALAAAAHSLTRPSARRKARGITSPLDGKFPIASRVSAPHSGSEVAISPVSAGVASITVIYAPMSTDAIDALSPLDGRYARKLDA